MIKPEMTLPVLNDDWTPGLAPAAGYLGVIEEECPGRHDYDNPEITLTWCAACEAAL